MYISYCMKVFVCLFRLRLYVPVKKISVVSGRSHRFLGITSTFWEVNVSCSRIQHGDLSEDRTPTSRSGVRRSTTRPPRLPLYESGFQGGLNYIAVLVYLRRTLRKHVHSTNDNFQMENCDVFFSKFCSKT